MSVAKMNALREASMPAQMVFDLYTQAGKHSDDRKKSEWVQIAVKALNEVYPGCVDEADKIFDMK